MKTDDSWKTFESTGSVQEYLQFKRRQQSGAEQTCPMENEHADRNSRVGPAGSENR